MYVFSFFVVCVFLVYMLLWVAIVLCMYVCIPLVKKNGHAWQITGGEIINQSIMQV